MNENEKEVSPFQNTCETSESIKKQYCEINQLYSFNIHCVRLKKKKQRDIHKNIKKI